MDRAPHDGPADDPSRGRTEPASPTWRTQWLQMTSPYSPDQLARIVAGAATRGEAVGVPDAGGTTSYYLIGRVRGTRIRVTARRPMARNGFAPRLSGSLVPYGNGCLLTARLGPPPVAMAFVTLWLTGAVAMFVVLVDLLVRDVAAGHLRPDDLLAVAVAGGMVAFGTALVLLGRRWGRPDGVALRIWLERRCRMTEYVQDGDSHSAVRAGGLSMDRGRRRRERGAQRARGD